MPLKRSIDIIRLAAFNAEAEGRVDEAERLYSRLLSLARRQYKSNPCQLSSVLAEVAEFQDSQSETEKAIRLYLEALSIYMQELGATNVCSTLIMARLANLYKKNGNQIAESAIRLQLSERIESCKPKF